MTKAVTSVALLAVFATANLARAQLTGIYVEQYVGPSGNPCGTNPPSPGDGWFPVSGFPNRGSTCPGATPQPGRSYGSSISFTGSNGAIYRVFAVDFTQSIGAITVSGSGYTLLVGTAGAVSAPPFTSDTTRLAVAGGGQIGAISATGGAVQARSTDSIASVNAGTIIRVDSKNACGNVTCTNVTGAIRAPQLSSVSATANIASVLVVNWDSGNSAQDYSGTIQSTGGTISTVTVTGARMIGTVTSSTGAVGSVTSNTGIGQATGTSTAIIRAQDGITRVEAPSIRATVDAKYNGGSGLIQTLRTTVGDFEGSLNAEGLTTGGDGITIFRSLLGTITLPANALTRQIILNAGNSTGTWGSATVPATVTIGTNTLSFGTNGVPYYTTSAASLGNGAAIGLAPFNLYREDSLPNAGTLATPAVRLASRFSQMRGTPNDHTFGATDDEPVRLRFYGPLLATSGFPNGAPFIELRNPVNTTEWNEVPSDRFNFTVVSVGGAGRELQIYAKSTPYPEARYGLRIPSGMYRISRGTLKCASVTGNPTIADFGYYYVEVQPDCNLDNVPDVGAGTCTTGLPSGCIADLTDGTTHVPDGGVTIDDLLYYLSQHEAGSVNADIDNGSGTGTRDGGVTIDDLLYYLIRFEAGC